LCTLDVVVTRRFHLLWTLDAEGSKTGHPLRTLDAEGSKPDHLLRTHRGAGTGRPGPLSFGFTTCPEWFDLGGYRMTGSTDTSGVGRPTWVIACATWWSKIPLAPPTRTPALLQLRQSGGICAAERVPPRGRKATRVIGECAPTFLTPPVRASQKSAPTTLSCSAATLRDASGTGSHQKHGRSPHRPRSTGCPAPTSSRLRSP
jgi:hypothetical protein